jgi:hypothetical protein
VSNVLTSKVKYPSLIDSSPMVLPSLDQNWSTPALMEPLKAVAEPVFYNEADMLKFEEKQSSLVDSAVLLHSQLNRQPSPPPVTAEVHHVTAASLPSTENGFPQDHLSDVMNPPAVPMRFSDESVQSRKPKKLHISVGLMDAFMRVANGNTRENLETCGVLAGSLVSGCVWHLSYLFYAFFHFVILDNVPQLYNNCLDVVDKGTTLMLRNWRIFILIVASLCFCYRRRAYFM